MKTNKFLRLLNIVSLLVMVGVAVHPLHAQIPVTGGMEMGSSSSVTTTSNLASFIAQVKNGSAEQITGLYIENISSFPVIQQPSDQPAYVSTNADLVTQFSSASSFGSLGFLAHNNLAGSRFSEIENGDLISVVFGDGHFIQYQVTQTRILQALEPTSTTSSFLDVTDNQKLTAQEVFYQTYGVSDQLVLQTCISSQGIDSWGRLFVIAVPSTHAPITNTVSIVQSAPRNGNMVGPD